MSTRNERMGDKALNDRHTKILKALMQRADNRKCADCRKIDPRWASWNLGILICIRCSGIHRSLGTHISKVKSADLDSWTPEQIENMVRWGNGKANTYWESQLPPGMEPPEHAIEPWIRAKYERKQYVRPGGMPDPDTLPLPDGVSDIKIPGTKKAIMSTSAASPTQTTPPANLSSTSSQLQQSVLPQQLASDDLFANFQSVPPQQLASDDLFANFQSVPPQQLASNDFFANFQSVPAWTASPPPTLAFQQPAPPQQNDLKAAIMSLFNSNNSTSSVNGPYVIPVKRQPTDQ